MQAGYLRSFTLWMRGLYMTAKLCIKGVIKSSFSTPTRAWINKHLHIWVNELLNLIELKVEIKNPHNVNLDELTPCILMPNHTSLLDIPISFYAFPKTAIRMLAKKELSRIPIMGRAMRQTEFPFVDRKNREQAIKDLAYAKSLMETGIVLWIAPEGTRGNDASLKPFKKGGFISAIQAKATIIPIMIENAAHVLGKNQFRINIKETVNVHIGKPIDASTYTMETRDKLIETVRNEMKTVL